MLSEMSGVRLWLICIKLKIRCTAIVLLFDIKDIYPDGGDIYFLPTICGWFK
jgi:hypothetical protein